MKIVIAGSSGFLGTALRRSLVEQGHNIVRLVRRPSSSPDESTWDPYAGTLDQSVIDTADVVVNLAGSSTAGNPHSKAWARRLRESRVTTTGLLAEAVARSHADGGSPAFLAGNGISYYGDHGDEVVREGADSRGEAWTHYFRREDLYSRIDFLMVSPGLKPFVPASGGTIHDGEHAAAASDHRAVWVKLDLEPAK